jgi:hypothetical protein
MNLYQREEKDRSEWSWGAGNRIDNKKLSGNLVDNLFEEKLKVVEEARKRWEDPAKAVEKYMKNIKNSQ